MLQETKMKMINDLVLDLALRPAGFGLISECNSCVFEQVVQAQLKLMKIPSWFSSPQ